MNQIQLVFANYHCAADISSCIGGLFQHGSKVPLDIVVVNNGGAAFESDNLQPPAGWNLQTLSPGLNSGYFGAMSSAVLQSEGKHYRYRVLCNPDLEFSDPTLFALLLDLAQERRLAVIAPSIISTRTKRDQNPYLRDPPNAMMVRRWKLVYSSWATYLANDWASCLKAKATMRNHRASSVAAGPIHAPHGAMMIFSEAFLHQERMLGQVPFLYAEELFIGEICRRSKWLVQYEPSLRVWHREHATTGVLPSKRRFELQRDSMRAFQSLVSASSGSKAS